MFALEELVTPSALFISELDNTCTDVLAFAVTTFDPAIILVIFLLTDFTDVIFLFNLATELIIQSASTRPDGSLLIKTISDTEENLKTIFQDGMKTKKMIIKERESTIGTYENYTELEGIMRYTAGILGVVLHKVGKSQLERIDALEVTTDDIVLMMADLIGGQE